MIPPIAVHCGFGALLALTSVPLALRKVPRNRWYGIRIPESFASNARWYDINAYGGRVLTLYGVALILFGLGARDAAPALTSPWMVLFTVGPLLGVFVPIAFIVRYARRGE